MREAGPIYPTTPNTEENFVDFYDEKRGERRSGRSAFALITALLVFASVLVFTPQAEAQEAAEADSGSVSCVEPPSGMTAWWGFERDGKKNPVPDLSGNEQNGKLVKKATRVNDAAVGAAVEFRTNASRVKVSNADLGIGTGDLSVDFWIKATDTDRTPDVVFDNRRNLKSGFHVYTWRGRPGIQIQGQNHTANFNVSNDQWQFVAITIDMDAGVGKFYKNGKFKTSFDFTPLGRTSEGKVAMLGRRWRVAGNEPLTGSLDEFEVFNRQLTDSEVKGIFEAGSAGKCRVSVEDTKELLQERLADAYGISSDSICDCVFANLLESYDGDLNALFKDLENFSARFQRVLGGALAQCQPACTTGNGIEPPDNLVGWYPFDNGSLASVEGTLPDLAGTVGVHPGYVDSAASFDGTMRLDSGPTSAFDAGDGDFAIDFWMNTDNMNSPAISIFDSREPSDWNQGFHIYTWRNRIGLQVRGINYSVATDVDGAPTTDVGFRDGDWHLVAVSYDDTVGRASFYFDGELLGTRVIPDGPDSLDTGNMVIGNSDIGGNVPYIGALDELELFNAQLSAADVRALYNAGPDGKCKPETEPVQLECSISPVPERAGDTFTASVSPAIPVDWSMGDANEYNGVASATHSYGAPGTYVVSYSVDGQQSVCAEFTVGLAVNCTINPVPTVTGESFTASTNDSDVVVDWDLGDGRLVEDRFNITHSYDEPGVYTVSFTFEGERFICGELTIDPAPITCVIEGGLPLDVGISFHAQTSDGSAVDWDMGDGTTYSNTDAVTHFYFTPGVKNIIMFTEQGEVPCTVDVVGEPVTLSASCLLEGPEFVGFGDLDGDGTDEPTWVAPEGDTVTFIQDESNPGNEGVTWSFVSLQGHTQQDLNGRVVDVNLAPGEWVVTATVTLGNLDPATATCGLVIG